MYCPGIEAGKAREGEVVRDKGKWKQDRSQVYSSSLLLPCKFQRQKKQRVETIEEERINKISSPGNKICIYH